ncbi:MAG TPA: hypothetical protein VLR47_09090 [Rhodospirillales bacterium]|nr:hypothetical protein [Rhodospirillales bacterium]
MRRRFALVIASLAGLAGCFGPPALRESVLGYDETVNVLNQDILLLNLARLSRDRPPHFTVTSSIAATFNFETSGGIGSDLQEGAGTDVLSLSLSSRAAENPTFSIVPVTGQEFTQRILTPVGEDVLGFFLFQGVRIELLSRLMADGIEILGPDGRATRFLSNKVTAAEGYRAFRRIVLHLGALQQSGRLFIQELTYDQPVLERVTSPPSTGDVVAAFSHALTWRQETDTFTLTRSVRGRILISNYDPVTLSHAERRRINEIAASRPDNLVLVDVRPGYPGGEFPIFAALKLRSLFAMLDFVAKGIELFKEFPVDPDPRTGEAAALVRNPVRTLAVDVSEDAPAAADGWIRYQGRYYTMGNTRWDRAAFLVLYELFQVTVTDVSRVGIPITIAK